MKPLLIGLDIGSTHIKAGAYDLHGSLQALAIRDNRVCREGSHSFYLPGELLAATRAALGDVLSRVDAAAVGGVAVASMAESGVPVDANGEPLFHAIAWFDQRTLPQAQWWAKELGGERIYRETGLVLQPKTSLCKLMWIRGNYPEVFRRIHRWLCMEDYILYWLSGRMATDTSIAGRTMAMDLDAAKWSSLMLDAAEISPDIFPEIHASGRQIGTVTSEAAGATGLPEGVPVVTGGHDHLCAALALGAWRHGDTFNSMGTAEILCTATSHRGKTPEDYYAAGISEGRHVVDGMFYALGSLPNSGASIEWLIRTLFPERQDGYGCLNTGDLAGKVRPSGLFFLPHLNGSGTPHVDPAAAGAIIGLRENHSAADIVQAVYEGLSYEFMQLQETVARLAEVRTPSLKIIGGSTRNPAWMRIKADVTGCALHLPRIEEAATQGAALLAGIGAGIFADADEALASVHSKTDVVTPAADVHAAYRLLYTDGYRPLYETLRKTSHFLHFIRQQRQAET